MVTIELATVCSYRILSSNFWGVRSELDSAERDPADDDTEAKLRIHICRAA